MQNSALQEQVSARASSSGEASLPNAPPTSQQPRRLCVLLVEDNEADVYLIRLALANNPRIGGVIVAKDGVEALELIDLWATEPDLAIVDLHMPRKDGFALLDELATRGTNAFPSVVLTSSRAGLDLFRARELNPFAYLTKPNSVAKLSAALGHVIASI